MADDTMQIQSTLDSEHKSGVKRKRSVKQRIRVKRKKSGVKRHRYILLGLFLILSLVVLGYYLDSVYKSKKEKTLKEKTLEKNKNVYSPHDLVKDLSNSVEL